MVKWKKRKGKGRKILLLFRACPFSIILWLWQRTEETSRYSLLPLFLTEVEKIIVLGAVAAEASPDLQLLFISVSSNAASYPQSINCQSWYPLYESRVEVKTADFQISQVFYCWLMGTLDFETENACAETYLRLGLRESWKENSGKPRVLSCISSLLERSVQMNEKFLETTQTKDIITIFHGTKPPSLSIGQYIDRIFKYSCCSTSCFIVSHIYVERFIQLNSCLLTSLNVHRLLITSVMVAAKYLDDAFYNNAYYAKVGGVTTRDLNKLEMKFLFALDFRLYVSNDTFEKTCMLLDEEKWVPG